MVSMVLLFPIIKTLKKEIAFLLTAKDMFAWKEFNVLSTCSMQPTFTYQMASSTYRFLLLIYCDNVGSIFLSNWTIKIPAITSPKGDPIAIPSFCKYICPLKKKCTIFVQWINRCLNSSFALLGSISLSV